MPTAEPIYPSQGMPPPLPDAGGAPSDAAATEFHQPGVEVYDGPAGARRSSRSSGVWLIILIIFALLLLSLGLAAVGLVLISRGKLSSSEKGNVGAGWFEPNDRVEPPEPPETPIYWTNAAENSLVLDNIKIQVDDVQLEPVRSRNSQNAVVVTGAHYLIVSMTITNRGPKRIRYRSWRFKPYRVSLADSNGRTYSDVTFSHLDDPKVKTIQVTIGSHEELGEQLFFMLPENVDLGSIKYFHLELPAQPVGGTSFFRFEIPRSMISGM